jgi:hypothetical protein
LENPTEECWLMDGVFYCLRYPVSLWALINCNLNTSVLHILTPRAQFSFRSLACIKWFYFFIISNLILHLHSPDINSALERSAGK